VASAPKHVRLGSPTKGAPGWALNTGAPLPPEKLDSIAQQCPKTQCGNSDAYEELEQSFENKDNFSSENGAPGSKWLDCLKFNYRAGITAI
jgi:hypothetical protein